MFHEVHSEPQYRFILGMSESFPLVIYSYTDRFTLSLFQLASKELIPSFEIIFVSSYNELSCEVEKSSHPPALILLDIDGGTRNDLEKLKEQNFHTEIPHILLSSKEDEVAMNWAKEFRALSVLHSPGNLESMKLVIDVVNIFTM